MRRFHSNWIIHHLVGLLVIAIGLPVVGGSKPNSCSTCNNGQGNFTVLETCKMETIQDRRMTQMWTSFGEVTVWIAFFLSSAGSLELSNFDIVTIGRSDGPSYVSDVTSIDCTQAASLNLTMNITSIGIQPGDIFYFYRQIQQLTREEIDFLFIDQSVSSPKVLHMLLTSAEFQFTNISTVTLMRYQDSPMEWCCITQKWHDQITMEDTDDQESQVLTPYSSHWSGTLSVDLWSQRSRLQGKVMMDIINSLGWTEIMILYDTIYEKQVRVLADLASTNNIRFRLVHMVEDFLRTNIIRFFEDSETFNVVVISSLDGVKHILDLTLSLEKSLGKSISVTSTSKWLLFPQDGRITQSSWISDTRFDNLAFISDIYSLSPDLGLTWKPDEVLTVTTLMYETNGRALTTVGSVDSNWDVHLYAPVFPNSEFGFNGRLFLVTTNTWDPYMYKRVVNGTAEFYGFCMDLAVELSRTLNFTMTWTEPPDGGWGHEGPNGSWTGMVGQVQREEVDMIIAPIGVTGAREKVIDFTFAFFYDDTAVIMKKPDPEKSKWRTYIDIFRKEVLLCIGASLLLGTLMIFMIEQSAMKVYRPYPKSFAITMTGCVWYLFGAMTNQGGRHLPISLSGRIFLSSWWLFCLVVVGTYSGNLIAVLTVTKDKPPFNTLEEMANQDEYKFGTLGKSMWTTLFETSPRPEFQALDKRIKAYAKDDPDVLHLDSDVHLEKVKRGSYAYIADKGLFQNWLAYNCDLMLLKEKFYPAKYAIGLPNKSVYTKRISDQVVKIYESGLLQIWIKRWWPKRSFCGGTLMTQAKTLTLVDVQSCFYLIGIGMGMGLVLLVFEALMNKLLPEFNFDICSRYNKKK